MRGRGLFGRRRRGAAWYVLMLTTVSLLRPELGHALLGPDEHPTQGSQASFDIASVKLSQVTVRESILASHGSLTVRSQTLFGMICWAYDVPFF